MIRRAEMTTETKAVRVAVYCRVSTIDQTLGEFTSIDNQRAMAEAYVRSQALKNWVLIDEHFDDPGYSASTVERPALRRLLSLVDAGGVDVVISLRLDRLSRSLSDFMKLMDRFRAAGVAFVSVTEAFSTDTPVGRLTMGLLATFAEFERATISARTSEKVSGARRRGRWTGGQPPLGYDVHVDGGKLVVNEVEAEIVRQVFDLYLTLGSLQATTAELNRRGWRTKTWVTRSGALHAGKPFTKNVVNALVSNPLYVGRTVLRGETFDGEHPAIVDQEIFDRVQRQLAANNVSGGAVTKNRYGHLLRGLLHCAACGCAMTPSVTKKKGRAFRYYTCAVATKTGWRNCPHPSLPARDIENEVVKRIAAVGRDPELVAATLDQVRSLQKSRQPQLVAERRQLERDLTRLLDGGRTEDQEQIGRLDARLAETGDELAFLRATTVDRRDLTRSLAVFDEVWGCLLPREQERVIGLLVERVEFDGERQTVAITFRPTGIRTLAAEVAAAQGGAVMADEALRVEFSVQLAGRRPEPKAAPGAKRERQRQDRAARRARNLALAHWIDGLIRRGEVADLAAVARMCGVSRARVSAVAGLLGCTRSESAESVRPNL
ncbi:MAG: recombinase family protein [Ahniella sp.]|nr:recombinase family protein [Ahniella sp.]